MKGKIVVLLFVCKIWDLSPAFIKININYRDINTSQDNRQSNLDLTPGLIHYFRTEEESIEQYEG